MKKVTASLFMLVLITSAAFAQGKIISKSAADELFGKPDYKISMPVEELEGLMTKSATALMFSFKDDKVYVLDGKRKVLQPEGKSVAKDEVFNIAGIYALKLLITEGGEKEVQFEKRGNVFTMSNGNYTLEYMIPCPPYCMD